MPPRSCPTCDSPRCGNHAACARKREAEIRDFARRATEAVQWHADWCALWATIDVAERAEEQHRRSVIGRAEHREDLEAVDRRQHPVEHDDVVGFGGGEEKALLSIARALDDVARGAQATGDVIGHVVVVFDNQNVHGRKTDT